MDKYILERTERLRSAMAVDGADAFVIITQEGQNWESLYYMSGFRGTSGALIVYSDSAELILDGRYIQQGREQSPHEITEQGNGLLEDVTESLSRRGAGRVLCEAAHTLHSAWVQLSSDRAEFIDGTEHMISLRRTKDDEEVRCIQKAAEIASSAFLDALNHVRDGMVEKEFEALLNYNINIAGGETGFGMIVASGVRSAMPHGRAGDRKMKSGEWVTVDFAARYKGYFCDITRNFSIGEPDMRAAGIHDLLLEAHVAAAGSLRGGVSGTDVYNTALNVLESKGMGKYFTHGLGHGFGLEIHEPPFLSSKRDDILKAGDIVTIEPGIYIEGWGGLRLEDDYLISETGAKKLTHQLNQCFYRI